jgi:hypothetical protein
MPQSTSQIYLDAGQVQEVSQALTTAVNTTLVPELTTLMTQVSTLLATDGGLYMEQTSPALLDEYTQFNNSMGQMMQNIISFANNFTQISGSLINSDGSLATQILTNMNAPKK